MVAIKLLDTLKVNNNKHYDISMLKNSNCLNYRRL